LITSVEALVVNSNLLYQGQFEPGGSAQVKITLANDRDEPEQVDFKLGDYGCNCEGEHFYDAPNTRDRTNASWIKLNTIREILAPHEKRDIYFTIKIPNDPHLHGSYWSQILIEPNNTVQTINTDKEMQLQIKIRYAQHVITTIGQGTAKLKILNKAFKMIGDQEMLCVDILNTGDLFLKPKLTLKLFSINGKLAHTLEAQAENLFPNNSSRFLIPTQNIKGKFKAFLLLDNGDNYLFGDNFEIEFS
jgi:hypothetical protein